MRLSEAIRLGSMLGPQAFGDFYDGAGACALGSAGLAIGTVFCDTAEMISPFPIVETFAHCPASECHLFLQLMDLVPHVNDDHCWTRGQIADWVETLEAGSTEQATSPTLDAVDPAVAAKG